MELTQAAEWLNNTFYSMDSSILSFWHAAAEAAGGFLTPLMKAVTFIGEKGIWLYALSAILLCFPKTRKIGVCLFGSVCCGALVTSIILKDVIARPRPYETDALFREFWNFIGSPVEKGFSFPSGHATSAMAGITALVLAWKKREFLFGYGYVILIACSRNYLMAHYPSDVLAGLIIGAFSAGIAYAITLGIFALLEKYRDWKFFAFILDFDIRHPFGGK